MLNPSDPLERLQKLEAVWRVRLPPEYRAFLLETSEAPVAVDPGFNAVRDVFELGNGPSYLQLDEVMRLVGDVIPPQAVPVAEDLAGNLYLLDCSDGPGSGRITWWDHERELGDHHTEPVEPSFRSFIEAVPRES